MDNYRSTALIVGVNGITGSEIARQLSIRNGWTVYGLSRSQHALPQGVRHVRADLQDAQDVAQALRDIRPTHVFLTCLVEAGLRSGEHPRQRSHAAQPLRCALPRRKRAARSTDDRVEALHGSVRDIRYR
ncbi:NAD-dependent epimerase/dehydratase family protein [Corynebacterium sp.]